MVISQLGTRCDSIILLVILLLYMQNTMLYILAYNFIHIYIIIL